MKDKKKILPYLIDSDEFEVPDYERYFSMNNNKKSETKKTFTIDFNKEDIMKNNTNEENDNSLFELSKKYYEGNGVKQDYSKAFEYLKRIKNCNADAKIMMGKCYLYGQGTKQDYELAFKLFKEAANEHNKEGKKMVIKCYENGWGVKQDFNKVLDLISNFDLDD